MVENVASNVALSDFELSISTRDISPTFERTTRRSQLREVAELFIANRRSRKEKSILLEIYKKLPRRLSISTTFEILFNTLSLLLERRHTEKYFFFVYNQSKLYFFLAVGNRLRQTLQQIYSITFWTEHLWFQLMTENVKKKYFFSSSFLFPRSLRSTTIVGSSQPFVTVVVFVRSLDS